MASACNNNLMYGVLASSCPTMLHLEWLKHSPHIKFLPKFLEFEMIQSYFLKVSFISYFLRVLTRHLPQDSNQAVSVQPL